jgi:hypothetical protein
VTRHQLEKKRWLRRGPLELFHALLFIPGTLSFVENDDVFMGRSFWRATKTLLKIIIDVLDPGPHAQTNGS